MVNIVVKRGLDLPIEGQPAGKLQRDVFQKEGIKQVALDLDPFEDVRFKVLVKEKDFVQIGTPLAYDKSCPERMFVSPGGGFVKEIRRGLKRRLLAIVIELDGEEKSLELPHLDSKECSREDVLNFLLLSGFFAAIKKRPFSLLANPHQLPRSLFVKALETAPFAPSAEMLLEGNENAFQVALNALAKLTKGKVHLVFKKGETTKALLEAQGVEKHTVEGPHPAANVSLHIHEIDPIKTAEDVVWTIDLQNTIALGNTIINRKYFTDRIMSIAGPAILEEKLGFFKVRSGMAIEALISNALKAGENRLISGDPLMGKKVDAQDFLGFFDHTFCAFPEQTTRKFLSFLRLDTKEYTFSRAYLTALLKRAKELFVFTTNQHGEKRAFIDSSLYDKVMPLNIPTMQLVKAVLSEDFDLAEELGLLEVDSEDFALPSFVCPSKIVMTDIIKHGLKAHAEEVLGKN
jgi:Na+-transporting NADH:ubiquinone oxidoreductase subunit A